MQKGFTLLVALFFIATVTMTAGLVFKFQANRNLRSLKDEQQWIQQQYADAKASFKSQAPNGEQREATQVQELLLDTRYPTTKRHLRQVFTQAPDLRPL
jgi:hypothetical protein